jgi:hypothetical protein
MDANFPEIVNLLWWQAMQRAEAAYIEFSRAGINVYSWNSYSLRPLYIHGRTSTERTGVRHLVYWYETGWEYNQYQVWEWQEWLQRDRYGVIAYEALSELDSDLLRQDERRCECCNRASRICALARRFEVAACDT